MKSKLKKYAVLFLSTFQLSAFTFGGGFVIIPLALFRGSVWRRLAMNLSLSAPYLLPKEGVYFGLSHRLGKIYRSIVNVGRNPTIGVLKERKVEAHLLDYPEEEGYGGTLYVEFLSFMREEKTFAGLDGLRKQLEMDKEEARRLPLDL